MLLVLPRIQMVAGTAAQPTKTLFHACQQVGIANHQHLSEHQKAMSTSLLWYSSGACVALLLASYVRKMMLEFRIAGETYQV